MNPSLWTLLIATIYLKSYLLFPRHKTWPNFHWWHFSKLKGSLGHPQPDIPSRGTDSTGPEKNIKVWQSILSHQQEYPFHLWGVFADSFLSFIFSSDSWSQQYGLSWFIYRGALLRMHPSQWPWSIRNSSYLFFASCADTPAFPHATLRFWWVLPGWSSAACS